MRESSKSARRRSYAVVGNGQKDSVLGLMSKSKTKKTASTIKTLAVDIGGSAVKAMLLDGAGKVMTQRERIETPRPATPAGVLKVISDLAKSNGGFDRVSVGFPGVVKNGITVTAPNLEKSWHGYELGKVLRRQLNRPVRVANDADVQGYGAIKGKGVELVLTLGTGLGSALFVDGCLVPNLELAHHRFRGKKTYEDYLGNRARKKAGNSKWNKHLRNAMKELDQLFSFDVVYLGGGNAKKITGRLPAKATIISNVAGLLGGIALWRE